MNQIVITDIDVRLNLREKLPLLQHFAQIVINFTVPTHHEQNKFARTGFNKMTVHDSTSVSIMKVFACFKTSKYKCSWIYGQSFISLDVIELALGGSS